VAEDVRAMGPGCEAAADGMGGACEVGPADVLWTCVVAVVDVLSACDAASAKVPGTGSTCIGALEMSAMSEWGRAGVRIQPAMNHSGRSFFITDVAALDGRQLCFLEAQNVQALEGFFAPHCGMHMGFFPLMHAAHLS
jgi:hypothetical protein